jgi:hypothetical protein
MMGTPTNILIGPVKVYYAPVGESAPADSVAVDTAWGGNWTDVGYTQSPLVWAPSRETYEVEAEQTTLPLKEVVTKERHVFETVLSELTSTNLQLAIGGTATTTGAGAGQVGKDELEAGGEYQMDKRAWGFEGRYVDSSGTEFPVRVFIFKATCNINGNLEFAKGSEAGIGLHINALEDSGKTLGKRAFKFQRVTAAATS